jgi:purine-nucleoside phosphorylase
VDDPHRDAARAAEAARDLTRRAGIERVDAVVVLGSGWDGVATSLGEVVVDLPTSDLPGFFPPAAPGHRGRLRICDLDGAAVLVYLGRTHLFEGHGPAAVAHPVRVAAAAGAQLAVLTNASGSLRPDWTPGTGAVVRDHINWTGVSPLTGSSFVDLTHAWSPDLRAAALAADPTLVEAVYAQMAGPSVQTGAETRMLRTLGADLVGMSTVIEAIAARGVGLELLGLSAVTTLEDSGVELDPDDVVAVATETAGRLGPVVRTVLRDCLARTAERTPS